MFTWDMLSSRSGPGIKAIQDHLLEVFVSGCLSLVRVVLVLRASQIYLIKYKVLSIFGLPCLKAVAL